MLGVLVLIVVMAVYAGLERDVKQRLLGFTPHILLQSAPDGMGGAPLHDWRAAAERARKLPHVESATAFIADNVILDVGTWQRPVMFRGIDTSDPAEVEGIEKLLDLEAYPESTADLGLDDRVVISSLVAEQFGLRVGDRIRLYSTRNFEQVMEAYRATENPPVREAYGELWKAATTALDDIWTEEDGLVSAPTARLAEAHAALATIADEPYIRSIERDLLDEVLGAMEEALPDADAGVHRFEPEHHQRVVAGMAALAETRQEEMDSRIFKNLKSLVLPKEADVVGVYLASQMVVTPDLFVPLPLAQGLSGLDDGVQGIALRLEDPYVAEQVATEIRPQLGEGWRVGTWAEQFQAFSLLISQQRVMMYFALSFIVLVSAFSMMSVMFTVTIQKRREIGVMKALGAAPGQIVRVFLYQGMILGVLGAALGVALGHVVIHFRGELQSVLRGLGFDPFSASFTGFYKLPAHHNPTEQVAIAVMAFVLCSLAALVPAFFAARSDAAKSLRNL